MERDQILAILGEQMSELRRRRVQSVALFGSFARGEATPDSDIDLLIEVERPFGYFELSELQQFLEQRLGRPVDLVTRDGLDHRLRGHVFKEAIRAA